MQSEHDFTNNTLKEQYELEMQRLRNKKLTLEMQAKTRGLLYEIEELKADCDAVLSAEGC